MLVSNEHIAKLIRSEGESLHRIEQMLQQTLDNTIQISAIQQGNENTYPKELVIDKDIDLDSYEGKTYITNLVLTSLKQNKQLLIIRQ